MTVEYPYLCERCNNTIYQPVEDDKCPQCGWTMGNDYEAPTGEEPLWAAIGQDGIVVLFSERPHWNPDGRYYHENGPSSYVQPPATPPFLNPGALWCGRAVKPIHTDAIRPKWLGRWWYMAENHSKNIHDKAMAWKFDSSSHCTAAELDALLGQAEAPKGVKHDQDKLRMDLLPPEAIKSLAAVLTIGAKTYGDRNWEKGIDWNRIIGATLRHIFDWMDGSDKDAESGLNPLEHALCELVFLVTFIKRGIGEDFRRK